MTMGDHSQTYFSQDWLTTDADQARLLRQLEMITARADAGRDESAATLRGRITAIEGLLPDLRVATSAAPGPVTDAVDRLVTEIKAAADDTTPRTLRARLRATQIAVSALRRAILTSEPAA